MDICDISLKGERIFYWITIFCHHWNYIYGFSQNKKWEMGNMVNLLGQHFLGCKTEIFFWVSLFSEGLNQSNIQFQVIYEWNNHFFQRVVVFKSLVDDTHVWIKNGIAQSRWNLQVKHHPPKKLIKKSWL